MKPKHRLSIWGWVIEICTIVALLLTFRPLCYFNHLNDIVIPNHYNILGHVDGWGDRFFLFLLPLLSLIFYVVFFILGKRYYKKLNYPIKITDQNASSIYKLGTRTMQYLSLFTISLFAYINNTSLAIAIGEKHNLNIFIVIGLICGLLFAIVVQCIKMKKNKGKEVL